MTYVQKSIIALTLIVTFALPSIASAHALNGSLTGTYTYKVERYRADITKQLKRHYVYTPTRVGYILNIIKHESGGSPRARNGQHVGLMQYTTSWKHHYTAGNHYGVSPNTDARLSAQWNIHRMAHVIRTGGWSKVLQHWKSTVNR